MAGDVKKREPYPLLVGTSTCSHRRARRQPLRKVHTATQPCTPGTRPMQTETDVRSSPSARPKRLHGQVSVSGGETSKPRHDHTWTDRPERNDTRYNLENTVLSERRQTKAHVFYDSTCMKHPGQGSRRHEPRGRWAGTGGDASPARGVFVGDESVLELRADNGCTAL